MAHISGVTTAARGAAHAWAPGGADSAKKRKHGKSRKVHPDARAGGGGPGHFRDADSFRGDDKPWDTVRHAKSPAGRALAEDAKAKSASGAAAAVKVQKPPKTTPLSKSLVNQSGPEINMDVRLQVLADHLKDGSIAAESAKTRIMPSNGLKKIEAMSWRRMNGKVSSITKKLVVRGVYTIRTSYGKKAKATDPSSYGRGTTAQDKASGNITLGFHESCHRKEYLDYLTNTAFPKLTAKVGMSESDFQAAVDQFIADFEQFGADIEQLGPNVDEVGYTLSQCQADGKC